MSERPEVLDRLVDAIDVGHAPVPAIVARGAVRARRRRGLGVLAIVVATTLVIGSAVALGRPGDDDRPGPVAVTSELPARLVPMSMLPALDGLPEGRAAWSPEQRTLWVPATLSVCGHRVTAESTSAGVRVRVESVRAVCTASAIPTAAVVGGVDERPETVTVVNAGARTYAVAEVPAMDELGAHGGAVCPRDLPLDEDPGGHGLGVTAGATAVPDLAVPDRAWVCSYSTRDAGSTPSGGTTYAWVRRDPPVAVDVGTLQGLAAVAPFPDGLRECNGDLGPRWLVVLAHGTDLTGVVVDDFGCGDVRLTDEPFLTPPGEAWQPGTVPGVLAAPEGLLDAIRSAAGEPSNR